MHRPRKCQKSRMIGYLWRGEFRESQVEDLLERAATSGLVDRFDTGRGHMLWLDGRPGQELRDLRNKISDIIGLKPEPRHKGPPEWRP